MTEPGEYYICYGLRGVGFCLDPVEAGSDEEAVRIAKLVLQNIKSNPRLDCMTGLVKVLAV